MYILFHKELYIVKEPLTKNCTHQTWRGKQIMMCDEEKPLQEWIDKQPERERRNYYIEPDAETQQQIDKAR